MADDYRDELDLALTLAREASAEALRRAKSVTAREKTNHSFVTELDLELELFLRSRIGERFPDDVLSGEEHADGGGRGERRWSIDPIDGTGNLVHDLPLWAVSIGLLDRGEPVLGVIAVPPLGELFWAVRGQGAFQDGKRLSILERDRAEVHSQDNISISTNALRVLDPRSIAGRIRDLGSSCCEQVFLSSDRLRCCIFLGEQAHDLAAGCVIVAEAGGEFAALDGRRLSPKELIAATPIKTPVVLGPPLRLAALLTQVRRYETAFSS